MKKRKSVLLLGGEGFIGRNIAHFLSGDKFKCFSVGIEESVFDERRDKFLNINPYSEKVENDCDVVVHLIDNVGKNGKEFVDAEKKMMENVGLKDKKQLILFSSAVVYANPDSEYGKRKIQLEGLYEDYCKKNGVILTIFRLFNIYGPYHIPFRQGGLVANIVVNYLNGKKTTINDMDAKRDFIYSQDMVKFIEYAIENKSAGIFDLATGKLMSIRELIGKIENLLGEKIDIEDLNNREDIVCPVAKNDFFKNIEFDSIDDGLKETIDFYKRNLDIINKLIN